MKNHFTPVRVRYGETDQMGVVHHGNYASYFELARIEWLEKFGVSYKKLEESGLMLPVYKMTIRYKQPAYFDDRLEVETILKNRPTAKIDFRYIVRNNRGEVLTEGETTLVFSDKKSKRPIRCPDFLLHQLGFK